MSGIVRSLLQSGARAVIRRTSRFRPQIRVGIIGGGVIAPEHIHSYEDRGIATVVGVCDVQAAALGEVLRKAPSARGYLDLAQMLREQRPEVVSICTWPQSHARLVEQVAEAGVRGILCEKPLALAQGEVDAMIAACRARGVKLAGGHQYRFHSNFERAAEAVRSGRLGTIQGARGFIKSTLANNGPHLIDTALFVLGDPAAVSVSCQCTRTRDDFNRGYPAEDGAEGTIDLGAYRLAIRTGDGSPEFFAIEVEGDRGRLRVTPDGLEIHDPRGTRRFRSDNRYRARQFRQFLEWVQGTRPDYAANAEIGRRSNELILALYESARQGVAVPLPLAAKGDVIRALYPAVNPLAPSEPPTPHYTPRATAPDRQLAMFGGPRSCHRWYGSAPSFGVSELRNLALPLATRRFGSTVGQVVKSFEREIAALYQVPAAVASTSGTAAIHVGLAALGLNPGDEVITTPLTDMGTVIPILACNCIPVFADVDPATGNLTADSIAARITPRTRAVILVHLFGRPAELGPIVELLRARNIALVEDCSQAHWAAYRGQKVGTFGEVGCFSLQQSKQITCGDGGYTLINRPELARRAALFVDKGWDRTQGLRSHLFLGLNYRMTELQGAIARAQAQRLPKLIAARRTAAAELTARLRQIPGLVPPPDQEGIEPSWWTYPFTIDEARLGVSLPEFLAAIRVEGVRTQAQYLPAPIFEYELFRRQQTYGTSGYPFTAFPYEPPRVEDFPGFTQFNRSQLFLWWSHRVRPRHIDSIAGAIARVAAYYGAPPAGREPAAPLAPEARPA